MFPSRVLRLAQVVEKTGLSRSTIYAQQSEGLFPKSFELGARAVGWLESEIEAVLIARGAGAVESEIKELVAKLVSGRRLRAVK